MSAALDDLFEPLGAPGWAAEVAADSRTDDPRFVLSDDAMASWALRKVAKARAAIAAVEADVAERKALLDDYAIRATASDRNTVVFMGGLLSDYHRGVLDDDPDRKTITLPEGQIKSRTTGPAVVIDDVHAVADWLDDEYGYREFTVYTPKVSVRDVRKLVEARGGKPVHPASGEVVPGLSVREGDTSFTIDTDGGQ